MIGLFVGAFLTMLTVIVVVLAYLVYSIARYDGPED